MVRLPRLFDFFYIFISGSVIISGLLLNSYSCYGAGIYLLYSLYSKRIQKIPNSGESNSPDNLSGSRFSLIWHLIFLAVSSLFLFSIIKLFHSIVFYGTLETPSDSRIFIVAAAIIILEIIFRISGNIKSRKAILVLAVLLIFQGAALILGGIWEKTDILMGFIFLLVTAIISFRRSYIELADILQNSD